MKPTYEAVYRAEYSPNSSPIYGLRHHFYDEVLTDAVERIPSGSCVKLGNGFVETALVYPDFLVRGMGW